MKSTMIAPAYTMASSAAATGAPSDEEDSPHSGQQRHDQVEKRMDQVHARQHQEPSR